MFYFGSIVKKRGTCRKDDVSSVMNNSEDGLHRSALAGHCQMVCGDALFALYLMNMDK